MAKVNKISGTNFNGMYSFLSSFNNSLLNVTMDNGTMSMNIEDKAIVTITPQDSLYFKYAYTYNGSTVTIGTVTRYYEGLNLSVAVSEELVFVRITTVAGWSSNAAFTFFYFKTDTNNYFGLVGNNENVNFHTIPLTDSNGITPYYATPILPYSSAAGTINYIKNCLVLSEIGVIPVPGVASCSTVTANSSIALPNGQNMFALGTNTLVEITT